MNDLNMLLSCFREKMPAMNRTHDFDPTLIRSACRLPPHKAELRDLLRFLINSMDHDSVEVRALTLKKLKFLFRSSHDQLQRLVVSSDVVDPVIPEIVQGGQT